MVTNHICTPMRRLHDTLVVQNIYSNLVHLAPVCCDRREAQMSKHAHSFSAPSHNTSSIRSCIHFTLGFTRFGGGSFQHYNYSILSWQHLYYPFCLLLLIRCFRHLLPIVVIDQIPLVTGLLTITSPCIRPSIRLSLSQSRRTLEPRSLSTSGCPSCQREATKPSSSVLWI